MPEFYCWEDTYGETDGPAVCRRISAEEAFPFLREKGHVVSLTGAGGKTSLMYWMAGTCCEMGMRVLVTTSTHIVQPENAIYAETMVQVQQLWSDGKIAVIGTGQGNGKLSAPPQSLLEETMKAAEIVLIEADGSRQLPCKAPGDREPVLLPECDIIVGVLGLSALGKSVGKTCFRPERALQVCGQGMAMMRKITETDLAKLFFSERGLRKLLRGRQYYPVINQCDDEEKLMQAGKIAKQLEILQRERWSHVFETQQTGKRMKSVPKVPIRNSIKEQKISEKNEISPGKTVSLIGSCFIKN